MSTRRLLIARNAAAVALTATALVWLLRYPTSTVGAPASASGDSTATVEHGVGGLVKVVGPVVSTAYGPVQVVAHWRDDILEFVDAPLYPRTGPVDRTINEEAIPLLITQSLMDQTVDVDTISGATQTSEGYRTSLQAALDARNAAPAEDPDEHAGHADM